MFNAHLEVYGGGKRIKVEYDMPFAKACLSFLPLVLLPTRVCISKVYSHPIDKSNDKDAYSERVIRPTHEDNFTVEYLHLHGVFSKGLADKPKLTTDDAFQDLIAFDMIIEAVAKNL